MSLEPDIDGIIDLAASCSRAVSKAGGSPLIAEEIMKAIPNDILDTMARNGIRFTFVKQDREL